MSQQDSINALDRTMKALELRKAGVSYDEIARTLGWKHRNGAYYAVKSALKTVKREPATELLTLELERLDALFWAMYPKAKHGDYGAVDRCIKLMERRAKLLGLDAPEKQELYNKVILEIEREAVQDTPADNAPQAESD